MRMKINPSQNAGMDRESKAVLIITASFLVYWYAVEAMAKNMLITSDIAIEASWSLSV